jgi:hypothetical protein
MGRPHEQAHGWPGNPQSPFKLVPLRSFGISAAAYSRPPMIRMEAVRACSGRSRCQAIIASCSVGKSVETAPLWRVAGRFSSSVIDRSSISCFILVPTFAVASLRPSQALRAETPRFGPVWTPVHIQCSWNQFDGELWHVQALDLLDFVCVTGPPHGNSSIVAFTGVNAMIRKLPSSRRRVPVRLSP